MHVFGIKVRCLPVRDFLSKFVKRLICTVKKENMIIMKSIFSRMLSLFLAIVLLIAMIACAKPDSKEESYEAGSSDQSEEVRKADESAAEQSGQADENTAEQGRPDEDAMQILKQADEAAQEKYDNLDLNDKESVIEMVRALTQIESAIDLAEKQQIATWDDDRKILSIDEEIRCVRVSGGASTTISYMKGRKGLVIVHYGGDDYCLYYVCDGTLIGRESGHSTGRLDFSGCLPEWKDDPAGETHSIIDGREVKDDYGDYEYDKEVKRVEEFLQKAEEVLKEAGE